MIQQIEIPDFELVQMPRQRFQTTTDMVRTYKNIPNNLIYCKMWGDPQRKSTFWQFSNSPRFKED